MAFKVARYFVYEGNTAYTRQRLVDALNPYFKEAKIGGGIYDYKIVCDETNNNNESIDRNELNVSIAIKPTKTIEFIMLNFIAGRTGSTWEELLS
jgi:phage tail sheath protein FI